MPLPFVPFVKVAVASGVTAGVGDTVFQWAKNLKYSKKKRSGKADSWDAERTCKVGVCHALLFVSLQLRFLVAIQGCSVSLREGRQVGSSQPPYFRISVFPSFMHACRQLSYLGGDRRGGCRPRSSATKWSGGLDGRCKRHTGVDWSSRCAWVSMVVLSVSAPLFSGKGI